MIEIGVDSFAATIPDPSTSRTLPAVDRMAKLLAEVEMADRAYPQITGGLFVERVEHADGRPLSLNVDGRIVAPKLAQPARAGPSDYGDVVATLFRQFKGKCTANLARAEHGDP